MNSYRELLSTDKVMLEIFDAKGNVIATKPSVGRPGFLNLNPEGGVFFDGQFAVSFPTGLFPGVRVVLNDKVVHETGTAAKAKALAG